MLLDPFFHLPNLRNEWDHLGSAHSLEVKRPFARGDVADEHDAAVATAECAEQSGEGLQLLARLHPTEELDAVLELIEYVGGFR